MPMSGMLRYLLFAGTCLCVCGAPALLRNPNPTQNSSVTSAGSTHTSDVESAASDAERTTGLLWNVGAGGGTGPHGRPEGIDAVTQTENGDSLDGRSGPSETGGEASGEVKKIDLTSEQQSEALSSEKQEVPINTEATGGRKQVDPDMSFPNRTPAGLSSQLETSQSQSSSQGAADMKRLPGLDSFQDKDPETSLASLTEPPNPSFSLWNQKPTFHSPIPPLVFVTPRTSTPFVSWSHDGATMSSLLDFLPESRPNLMPKEDGPESLWTVAARPVGDSTLPLPQDEATETTMSSEALPLIFEPFEDAQAERAAPGRGAAVTLAQPPGSMVAGGMPPSESNLDQLVTSETNSDNGPSHSPPVLIPDWTSMWQTSGAELLEPISQSSGPSASPHQVESEAKDLKEKVAVKTPNLEDSLPSTRSSLSSFQHRLTTVSMATHRPAHRSRPGLEEMESDEEQDEDEEDENSEDSVEEDSEEELTETPKTSFTPPPYSLIPPPPVWVHSNQGLMRSWLELIREKAGYVSGMLAPVGIGITGALLIVGALYSIRMIHRKRRNSFKHQRRKVRQPEQPREPSTSRQDQAMLLADSSEDEF